MMGDFNTGDREPGHAVLASELHDAFAEAGSGFASRSRTTRMGPITVPVPLVRHYVWTMGSKVSLPPPARTKRRWLRSPHGDCDLRITH